MKTKTLKVKSIGEDVWSRNLFQNIETDRIYVDVDGRLHTTSKDGEPDCPILNKIKYVDRP